jgi:hypothetical protein
MSQEEEEGGGTCSNNIILLIDEFAEKFEEDFSLGSLFSSNSVAELEDIGAWFVDNGSSRHMTRMRSMFLSVWRRAQTCM